MSGADAAGRSPALAALLGAGPELLRAHADHARSLAAAEEVWTTRTGSVLTLDRGDHELEVTYDAERVPVGVSVVVHAPTAEVLAGVLTHALDVLGLTAADAAAPEGPAVHADAAELVVLEAARSIHVLRDGSGTVTQVRAVTPVPIAQRDLVLRTLAPADGAAVRAFLEA